MARGRNKNKEEKRKGAKNEKRWMDANGWMDGWFNQSIIG